MGVALLVASLTPQLGQHENDLELSCKARIAPKSLGLTFRMASRILPLILLGMAALRLAQET